MLELAKWDSFYVIVGSAAGALIGLQFVVLTLLAERPPAGAAEAGAAFGSPTIVHFGVALFLSALLHAPWQAIDIPAVLWGLLGFGGVVYAVIVARRMRKQSAYEPQFEDWLFHCALPLVAYAMLGLSSFAALAHTRGSVWRWRRSAVVAFHRHSQRVGQRYLPCTRYQVAQQSRGSRRPEPIARRKEAGDDRMGEKRTAQDC